MSGPIHRADAEDHIVLGYGQRCLLSFRRGAPLPIGSRGFSPHDLVAGAVWSAFSRRPAQRRVVVQRFGDDLYVTWRRRSGGERGQCSGIQPRHVGHVVEVDKLQQISVLHAVFDANVLMLMVIVLTPLGKTHGGEAFLIERAMVATAQIAVAVKDENWPQRRDVRSRGWK